MQRLSLIQTVPRAEKASTWLQLFFDLIYVAILVELGDQLAGDLTLAGLGLFVLVFVPVFWSWLDVVDYGCRYPVDDLGQRVLTVLYMGLLLLMAFEIHALADLGATRFVLTFGLGKLVLALMYARAWLHYPDERHPTSRRAAAFVLIGTLWIAIAFLAPADRWLWLLPIALGLAVPYFVRHAGTRPTDTVGPLDARAYPFAGHRFGELTIIVLGEFFIKLVTSSATRGLGTLNLLIGAALLGISVSLWWLYFDHLEHAALRKGALDVVPWTYAHFPFIVAITAYGVVGNKVFGAAAHLPLPDAQRVAFASALAIALASFALVERSSRERDEPLSRPAQPWLRLAAAGLLLVVAILGRSWSAGAVVSVAAASLLALVAFDVRARLRRPPPRAEEGSPTSGAQGEGVPPEGRLAHPALPGHGMSVALRYTPGPAERSTSPARGLITRSRA